LLVVPGSQKDHAGFQAEAVKAIVRPDFKQIQADTKLSQIDWMSKPAELKKLVWQNINDCQKSDQQLASFECVPSRELVEIKTDDFNKTSIGKIKRSHYIEAY